MFLANAPMRMLHFLLFCLGKAGLVGGRFWVWAVLAPAVLVGAVSFAEVARVQTASGDRTSSPGTVTTDVRVAAHQSEGWLLIAAHLPDRATASAEQLETAGDVLRARRYPEDALVYYGDAMQRGGNQERLLNKLGITELGLRRPELARAYLKEVVRRDKKNADAWNNLGATEYMDRRFSSAVSAYRKALKLAPQVAVFHANLGTLLVEERKFDDAREELAKAIDIDPEIGSKKDNAAGISAHVLSAEDHARYCFEIARVYAGKKNIEAMLHALAMASESGMDIRESMAEDPVMMLYVKDPQVILLIQNAKALRKATLASAVGPAPGLPPAGAN